MRIGDLCLFRQTKPLYTDRAILPNKIEGYSPDVRMLRLHTWPRCMNGTCSKLAFSAANRPGPTGPTERDGRSQRSRRAENRPPSGAVYESVYRRD